IAQAGIAAELDSDLSAFIEQWNGEYSVLNQWGIANYGPNGRFGSGSYALCIFAHGSTESCDGTLYSASPGGAKFEGAGVGTHVALAYQANVTFELPAGVPGNVMCTSTLSTGNSNLTLYEIGGKKQAFTFANTGGGSSWVLAGRINSTATTVWYSPYASFLNANEGCSIYAQYVYGVSTTSGSEILTANSLGCNQYSPPCSTTTNFPASPGSDPLVISSQDPSVWGPNGGSTAQVFGTTITVPDFGTYFGNLEAKAQLAGEAYWAFLRSEGYRSISQIPANCIIPYPSGALPQSATNALGNATAAEDLAIYEAWLNGLATFFNTPVNSTNYCSGHPTFKGAGLLPAPNGVNVTGFVYLPNTTAYPHEKFGNVTTWALNGTLANRTRQTAVQMVLYPTVATVSIPVGAKYEVPSNDPLVAIAPIGMGLAFPQYYNLLGNGTRVNGGGGVILDASSPGAAVYLTSCSVSGVSESNCTITLQNLQGYLANISCPSGVNGCGTQPAPAGAFSLGGLLSALGSFFCAITFGLVCGGAANLAAEVATALLVLALVVVGVVLIGDYIKRPRGGSSPPRGS
ncbi:MAG TPA: hypothetical protein VGS23_00770, partial [Thermoplasmata archaeon]|nr:hypothetical protein [Thermoplasmata archaeon]